jgi:SAM-dependent methyltransferase
LGRLGGESIFFARRGLLAELRPLFPELTGAVLDVGCGRKPYRARVAATRYVGVDVETEATRAYGDVDVFYDGRTLPFATASFDGVLCSQVLEHVFTPEEFLCEIARVLRPGGRLVLAVPFAWDEHEQPNDFARYSSFGLRALLERTGFNVVVQRKSCADARALVQLASGWLFKVTRSRSRPLNVAVQLGLIAPVNAVGAVLGAVLPANEDFYLDNVVLARRRP